MRTAYYPVVLMLAAAVAFIPFLGAVPLFDWDEVNFAEIAREMLVRNDYLNVTVDFIPFIEKPPFFFWLQTVAMRLLGVNETGARFPNAVCGVLTLPLLYYFGKQIYNARFGLLWAAAYGGSILPFFYFKSGIIDPWFNLFIFAGYYFLYRAIIAITNQNLLQSWAFVTVAGASASLAMLTKGPVSYLVIALSMGLYAIWARFRPFLNLAQIIYFTIFAYFASFIWYSSISGNDDWLRAFIAYQIRLLSTEDAGHGGFPGYHFVVLFFGVFPASIFAFSALAGRIKEENETLSQIIFKRLALALFWVVLILFSLVQSKIVHYSSLCYFPLTYLATLTLFRLEGRWTKGLCTGLLSAGLLLPVAVTLLPIVGQNVEILRPLLQKDPFAAANLSANVEWNLLECGVGLWWGAALITAVVLGRRGKNALALAVLFGGTATGVFLTTALFVPKIERYSQGAAIDFCKSVQNEPVYVRALHYKTYIPYFYTNFRQPTRPEYYSDIQDPTKRNDGLNHWLRHGAVDRPVYFITKIQKRDELAADSTLQEVVNKNGFVVFRRKNWQARSE